MHTQRNAEFKRGQGRKEGTGGLQFSVTRAEQESPRTRTGLGRSWLEVQEGDRAGVTRNLGGGNWPEPQQQGVGVAVLR